MSNGQGWLATAAGAMALAMLIFVITVRRRKWLSLASLVFIIALLSEIAGCGGGSGGGVSNPGTTPGIYTFTVKASYTATSGPAQTQTTVSVTIQ